MEGFMEKTESIIQSTYLLPALSQTLQQSPDRRRKPRGP